MQEPYHQLPHGTRPLAVDILKHVRPGKGNPDLVDTTVTAGMLKKAFQVWPERTYTSPRGTNLGHYKVWLRDYLGSDETEEPRHSHLASDEYFEIQALKLNWAITLRHPLKRWEKVTMLLLPKDKGEVTDISRIRHIDFFDAELNLLRRLLISHRAMQSSEEINAITKHQWGGRRKKQCSDLSLQSELHMTMLHLTRRDGSVTDIDASNCFDNIPPSLMSLCYSKLGLPHPTTTFFSKALLRYK